MKTRTIILMWASALVAGAACADNYYWNNASGGYWDEAANWASDSGSGTYPGYWDNIGKRKVNAPFTITLRKNEFCSSCDIGELNSGTGYQTFELDGHYLYVDRLYFAGCGGSTGWNVLPARGLEFKNGSLAFNQKNGFGMGYYSQNNPGTIVFTDCSVTGHCFVANGQSTITVRGGSTWVLDGDMTFPTESSTPMSTRNCFITVTGETSRVEASDYSLNLCHIQTGYFLFDDTSAEYANVTVGSSTRSTNVVMSVRNATLAVGQTLKIGSGLAGGKDLKLTVAGSAARVTAGTLTIYDGQAATLDVQVPTDGFKTGSTAVAPIVADALELVSRGEGLPDAGDLALSLTCYEWVKAHPEETIPIVRLTAADAESLAALAAKVAYADVPASLVAQGFGPILTVSADGTTLSLTAPALNFDPVFLGSSKTTQVAGKKDIVVRLVGYGAEAESIVSITCEYADNDEFTGSATTNFLAGLSPVTTAVPCDLTYRLDGGFVQYETYYARVRCTNENGRYSEQTFSFVADAVAETFNWPSAKNGCWQDVSNWTVDGVTPASYPHAEDTVCPVVSGSYVISLSEDAEAVKLSGGRSSGRLTFGLAGHTLTLNGSNDGDANVITLCGWETGKDDWKTVGAVLAVSNGTLKTTRSGMLMGYVGSSQTGSCGTLVLEDGAVFDATVKYFSNSSRIFVKGGSVLKSGPLDKGLVYGGHTGIGPYPRVSVEGPGSKVAYSDRTIRVRGYGSAMRVMDGGRVEAKRFDLGGDSFMYAGSSESPSTRLTVSNGTVAVGGDFLMGWTSDLACTPQLVLDGTGAVVTVGGTLKIYEGLAASVEYELPKEGYAADPLAANALEIVPLTAGHTDFGATALRLRGVQAWAKAHRGGTMRLLKLAEANAEGLAALRDATTSDWAKLPSGSVSVSADGTELLLAAPPRAGVAIVLR